MLDLIERKAAGEEIAVQPQAEEPAAAPDLMAALEASLAAVRPSDDDASAASPRPRSRASGRPSAKSGVGQELTRQAPAKAKS